MTTHLAAIVTRNTSSELALCGARHHIVLRKKATTCKTCLRLALNPSQRKRVLTIAKRKAIRRTIGFPPLSVLARAVKKALAEINAACGEEIVNQNPHVGRAVTALQGILTPEAKRTEQMNPWTIRVEMEGGLISDVKNIPDGTEIVVYDYDVEGQDPKHPNMGRDEEGKAVFVNRWTSKGFYSKSSGGPIK